MTERPVPSNNPTVFGSDPMALLLRQLGYRYIALTPGASFRGLHDSLVNYLGNEKPELLLCIHEESAVALAHGWTRVTGLPMPVALHSNVGLMHATMAIFNAWCDRIPMVILGAQGPLDAMARRPWVDWIHTSTDLGSLVRGYTKWDNQPGSVPAALEAITRAHQIATTQPAGPTYVCLDAGLQELPLDELPAPLPLDRHALPASADPDPMALAAAVRILEAAERPLIMIGRVSSSRADWDRRVRLAEALGAHVLTDIKTGASFPTSHPAQPFSPTLYVTPEAGGLIRDADAILVLDWIDPAGTMRQACMGDFPKAKVIQCSLDQYSHNGWSMDYQALPPADINLLASPDRMVERLLQAFEGRADRLRRTVTPAAQVPGPDMIEGRMSVEAMARTIVETLAPENPSYMRLPLGWPGASCRFNDPLDYIGFDGGGGIGSGPGMAAGAAMALRDMGSDRLPVAVLGDGDFLMGVTAIWTAVHYKVPMLVLVANNRSFFNDELHQERMARLRGRPIENRSIGLRMEDPPIDLAMLAQGQGAHGIGDVKTPDDLGRALTEAVARVRAGDVVVIDVSVAPEYARATSNAMLRQAAPGKG
ncbi:MAG: thiamine pyrophosphate-binding protein [Beijerinckiaceae bacterium]|jgi:thiamine pyrophosphate-dependent acetolactate synthase large subunit-like protein|nr:thiamine pyrophosphate-binding protein [Beijerinckiaceae bacterium]